jgi:hypothetical protein
MRLMRHDVKHGVEVSTAAETFHSSHLPPLIALLEVCIKQEGGYDDMRRKWNTKSYFICPWHDGNVADAAKL